MLDVRSKWFVEGYSKRSQRKRRIECRTLRTNSNSTPARRLRLEQLESRYLLSGDSLVQIQLSAVDDLGNLLSHIEVGDEFRLRGTVSDLRSDGDGVFAAYTDITFDSKLVSATGPLIRADAFSGGLAEHSMAPGEYSEVGGFRPYDGVVEIDLDQDVVFEIPFKAESAGEIIFATNPADTSPDNDVLLFGQNTPVEPNQINYGFLRVQIGSPVDAPPSAWRNPGNPFDVDNDGAVSSADVDQLRQELLTRGERTLPDPDAAGSPPYFDVTGDALITADDLVVVENQLPAPPPELPDSDSDTETKLSAFILEKVNRWLELPWTVQVEVKNGLTDDPVSTVRVGDVVHVHAYLSIPESIELMKDFNWPILTTLSKTSLAYDPEKMSLLRPLSRQDARAVEQHAPIDPTMTPEEMRESLHVDDDKLWLVGASFVALETGSAEFLTLPRGHDVQDGSQVVLPPDTGSLRSISESFENPLSDLIQQADIRIDIDVASDRPVATNDLYQLDGYNQTLSVPADRGVLVNDSFEGSGQASALLIRQPAHGNVVLNPDGSFRYRNSPDRLFHLSDSFEYVVVQEDGTSELAKVDIRADSLPPIADVLVRVVDSEGQPITSVSVGEQFFLQGLVADLRPADIRPVGKTGVYDVYMEVSFDPEAGLVPGEVIIDPKFTVPATSVIRVSAEVSEGKVIVRGYSGRNPSPGPGENEVFRVPMVATTAGVTQFTVSDARAVKVRGLLSVPNHLVARGSASLVVEDSTSEVVPMVGGQDYVVTVRGAATHLLDVLNDESNDSIIEDVISESGVGEISIDPNQQQVRYTPPEDFIGTAVFRYAIREPNRRVEARLRIHVASRWQNPDVPSDSDGDGVVAPIDALIGINSLIASGARALTNADIAVGNRARYYDVSGDGFHAPGDILIIVNYLNLQAANAGEGEGEPQHVATGIDDGVPQFTIAVSSLVHSGQPNLNSDATNVSNPAVNEAMSPEFDLDPPALAPIGRQSHLSPNICETPLDERDASIDELEDTIHLLACDVLDA